MSSSDNHVPSTALAAAAATTAFKQQQQEESVMDDAQLALYYHCLEALTTVYGFNATTAQEALDQVLQQQQQQHDSSSSLLSTDQIITLAYNYIFDHDDMAQDHGGPVVPLDSCPHCTDTYVQITIPHLNNLLQLPMEANTCNYHIAATTTTTFGKAVVQHDQDRNRTGLAKAEYDEQGHCPSAGENWLCLSCGAIRCSRYINGHALEHWQATTNQTTTTSHTNNNNNRMDDDEDDNNNDGEKQNDKATSNSDHTSSVGHALAVSLADLSVWCYACQVYLRPDHNALLQPLVQRLQELKFGSTSTLDAPNMTMTLADDDGSMEESTHHHRRDQHHHHHHHHQKEPRTSINMMEEAHHSIASLDISDNLIVHDDNTNRDLEDKDDHRQESMSYDEDDDDDDDECDEEGEEETKSHDGGGARGYPLDISGHGTRSNPYHDDDVDVESSMCDEDDDDHDDSSHHPTSQSPPPQAPFPLTKCPSNLEELAQFILSNQCQRIVILAGAGMSVASGIPDFRSSHNGLYATINPDILSCTNAQQRDAIRLDPTVALQQDLFLENPLPCLELLRTFCLNTHAQVWKATLTHRFVELLAHKTNKLVRLYTQNIDGLEGQCTLLARDKVCHVHGTMDRAECARCERHMDMAQFCQHVQSNIKDIFGNDHNASSSSSSVAAAPLESSPIICPTCGYPTVKPAIVLFRSRLPTEFFEKVPQDIAQVDLLLIIGTSLTVSPANSLVFRVPSTTLRVVINQHRVGRKLGIVYGPHGINDEENDDDEKDQEDQHGHQYPAKVNRRDFFARGDCEEMILELMTHLGWLPDLKPLLDHNLLPESSAQLLRNVGARLLATSDGSNDDAINMK